MYLLIWFYILKLLSKLYMDTGLLIWNGNSVMGCMEIQQFLEKLPASEHHIVSLDAQPMHGA